jgi:hypothetical protein
MAWQERQCKFSGEADFAGDSGVVKLTMKIGKQ